MKSYITTLLGLFTCVQLSANEPQAITTMPDGKAWVLQTKSSVYQLGVGQDGVVKQLYYGNAARGTQLSNPLGDEITVRGGYSQYTPAIEAIFGDHVRDIELNFTEARIETIENYPTLIITQTDKHYPLTVTEYLRVLPEYDLIEKWIEVKNTATGKKAPSILIENCQSGSIFLPKNSYELTHYSGSWACEMQEQTTKLTQGTKILEVRNFKSFGSSTFCVRPEGETSETEGELWFGSVKYSGNWRLAFTQYPQSEVVIDRTATGLLQIVGGANFWDQSVTLKGGETFTTPRMVFGYSDHGMEGASQSLASFTREQLLPLAHRDKLRPIVYNSWFVTGFDVNEENQVALAHIAKDLGVETFVVDDGWFTGRTNGNSGMGDWTVDKNKFPNGIKSMIKRINDIGLDFGIWIEPEMVSLNSNLYKEHPDWIFHFPNRERHMCHRDQFILNLAREDVYQYIHKCLSDLLRENNISYIKIDANQALTDPGVPSWPVEDQRAVRLKYYENFYRLIDQLRAEFPDVWFESCSGGGGRNDLAILSHMDFIWTSDNCDPVDRTFIQYSFLSTFPANTMLNLVCDGDWHGTQHLLEYKFDVSMYGLMGIGANIVNWTDEEREIAKRKIAQYKEIRHIIQFGDHYRLVSPYHTNRSVLQFVSKDGNEGVVCVYNMADYPNNAITDTRRTRVVKLRGLDAEATYTIEGDERQYSGSHLMNVGYEFPVWGAHRSGIFKINKL